MVLKSVDLLSRLFIGWFLCGFTVAAQEPFPAPDRAAWHGQQRSLRYHPEGKDFVITNGSRRFNRALYGTHTAFRVEAGDLPEFALYMPGMGGNLKIGLLRHGKSSWLIHAKQIVARYSPGKMSYHIKDPLLGQGTLRLEVLAMAGAEGIVLQTSYTGTAKDIELIYAFGGASAKKFSRSGDMGPDPESSFYLHPEYCLNNKYILSHHSFQLKYGKDHSMSLTGVFPSALKLADASQLADPLRLYQSQAENAPVVTAKTKLVSGRKLYVVISNPAWQADPEQAGIAQIHSARPAATSANNTPAAIFAAAETARKKIADRIAIETPDPFINTLGGTISIAADAIWEQPSYLHGAVGWRMRLNGWRGAYAADPLGWHDRARTHFRAYAKSQVTAPVSGPVAADTAFHLARHQEKMGTSIFTSGYISRDPDGKSIRPHHYDMNMVYIDQLLWHFNWTGDLEFVKEMWPVLKRHLAWEKRNFDPDNDGLYDAYAAIWASDALYYSGGAVTHSSAYHYQANLAAERIAKLLGEPSAAYGQEAARIISAIISNLWMPGNGVYAEYKDGLGNKSLHPSAALWTIYHSIDAHTADPFQADQSLRYIDREIPHIPVTGTGLPAGNFNTLSTSNWMPYTWSVNNVAMAESMHTALAYWEAGKNEKAFNLFKSELLAAMYMGGSPGNFVQISHYDAIRGEAYRDFADPIGISSRALVEGLFGILPDALHRSLTVRPGFPASWNHAALTIPDLDFKFKREGSTAHYILKPSFKVPMALKLQVKVQSAAIRQVRVNGKKSDWSNSQSAIGEPEIEINVPAASIYDIQIDQTGEKPKPPVIASIYAAGDQLNLDFGAAAVTAVKDPQQVFTAIHHQGSRFHAILRGKTGNHSAYIQLKMNGLYWWYPVYFELKPRLSLSVIHPQQADQLQFRLHNHSGKQLTGALSVNGSTLNDPVFKQLTLCKQDSSAVLTIPHSVLVPGNNRLLFSHANGLTDTLQLISWTISGKDLKQQTVDLSAYFNDQVTQVFRNKYLSPRPAGPTLQLPWQGIGDWPHALETAAIDDRGLRQQAGKANEYLIPQGIRFKTPGTAGEKNILFTSQWDNYPTASEIPLKGRADHAYFLMAGSTNHMQSQFDNGKIVVTYTDGSADMLLLHNPETWWPIQQDYYTDGFAFKLKSPRPVRIYLKTGKIMAAEGHSLLPDQQMIDGGAATVLDLPLDGRKNLKSLRLVTLANDVVIGLMSVTLIQY